VLVVPVSLLSAIVLLLAAAAIVALVRERVAYRQTLLAIAERLDAIETLGKFEIKATNSSSAIDQALNRAIQRSREQTQQTKPQTPTPLCIVEPAPVPEQRFTVAVLSIDLRHSIVEMYTPAYSAYLVSVADTAARAIQQTHALLKTQGDGTLLVIFGARLDQPIAASIRQALDLALLLSTSYPDLRFGLSCGAAWSSALPGLGETVVGAPLEDATRLSRMAAAWHEYNLLCTEPTALLARAFPSQRTPLQLTHPAMPMLPVYALQLDPATMAMSA
jgi:hypothetical protein